MTYSLFLDDERFPPNDGKNWEIARNFDDVLKLISTFGAPSYISFDHDLGEDEINGHEIVKKMVEMDMDGMEIFTEDFGFYVHSQNPIGKKNIDELLKNYIRIKGV